MDLGEAINVLENSLRDLVERLLRRVHGDSWFEHIGVSDERIEAWRDRREEEPKRRPGGEVEQRLLYYAEFYDLNNIIGKNWDAGFKDCFKDKKRFDVYIDRLSAFRNPDAHSRALLPFEEQLVLGMTGELRQELTLFLSTGAGGPEPEHFARIEEVRDNFGTRAVGEATAETLFGNTHSDAVLRPGDTVSFIGRAWDPEGGHIEWRIFLAGRSEHIKLSGSEIEWDWQIEQGDISETSYVQCSIVSARPYGRKVNGDDDTVTLFYRVLPPRD
jgi:hypothetical protein